MYFERQNYHKTNLKINKIWALFYKIFYKLRCKIKGTKSKTFLKYLPLMSFIFVEATREIDFTALE